MESTLHVERRDYTLEWSDSLMEWSDQRMEQSDLELSEHGTKWPDTLKIFATFKRPHKPPIWEKFK